MAAIGRDFRTASQPTCALLISEFGFTGPHDASDAPEDPVYRSGDLRYRIGYNPWDRLVEATAGLRIGAIELIAPIPGLVFTAGMGPLRVQAAGQYPRAARTPFADNSARRIGPVRPESASHGRDPPVSPLRPAL